jgi:small GTP-binding protein
MNKKCFKLVLLGDTSVGKSSIVSMQVRGKFIQFQEPTIGAAFITNDIMVNQEKVQLQIWDTAGQERYKSLAPMYYRSAASAIVVYDITNYDTYSGAKKWIEELKIKTDKCFIILVGNKSDLADRRSVNSYEASSYASKNGLTFLETSAKDSNNITELFKKIATELDNNDTVIDIHIKKLDNSKDRLYCTSPKVNKCC